MNTFGIFEIDSDSCNESESEIILRRKIRVNVLNISESEEIEDNYVQSTASSDII